MNQFSNDERLVVSADNVNKAYKHLLLNPDIQRDLTQKIDLPLINCENGVYNLETGELEKHSPQFGFTSYIQAKYDKNAKGKVFKRFLKDITAGNKDSIQFLQEVIGYLLSTYVWAKKAFIFYGVPNSGKSEQCRFTTIIRFMPCCTIKGRNSEYRIRFTASTY